MLKLIRRILQKLLNALPEETESATVANDAIATQKASYAQEEIKVELRENSASANRCLSEAPVKPITVQSPIAAPQEDDKRAASQKSEDVILSDEQMSAFREMNNSNQNLFITGKAGTGKSVLLRYFQEHTSKQIVVLAPTGIAAINVGGQTIHSFFELSPSIQTEEDFKDKHYKDSKEKIIQRLDAVVIDEISMVRADLMDAIDICLQIGKRKRGIPFGGCQIIAFGDLYQLPPVEPNAEDARRYYEETYRTLFFFGAPAVRRNPFKIIELTEVFRQKDPIFIDLLNQIRTGCGVSSSVEKLNGLCCGEQHKHDGIIVVPWKKTVQEINNRNLAKLPGDEFVFSANARGSFLKCGKIDEAKAPADPILTLKIGAKVMMLNNDRGKNWVNGTFATIEKVEQSEIVVSIKGEHHPVSPHVWEEYAYRYEPATGKIEKMVSGTYEQYPIRVAYAITIHKSQGQTYDQVTIDYGNGSAFACGQTYVALSRCRSLDGLWLKSPLKAVDIKVNDEAKQWIEVHKSEPITNKSSFADGIMHWSDEVYLHETK